MKLGEIQRDIIGYLQRCGSEGGYIGITTKAPEFRGYEFSQVAAAVERLLLRRIIRKEGLRYIIVRTA